MSVSELIRFEQQEHLAIVTLNRPEVRNALNPEMLVRLAASWRHVRDDHGIRAVVLQAEGPAFCSGLDFKSMMPLLTGTGAPQDEWEEQLAADPAIGSCAMLRDFDVVKPVIAAVNGLAFGGGMELTLACDLRVASEGTRFAMPEVKWAMFPGAGGTVRLPRQMPFPRAMEMLLTGEPLAAEELLQLGFLSSVVSADQLRPKALELARRIAANGPVAVQAIRQAVWGGIGMPESDALARESELAAPVFATEDAVEGARAFVEKRQPCYRGQ